MNPIERAMLYFVFFGFVTFGLGCLVMMLFR